ncbi:hypothetical protein PSENEW3n2_00000882 [Picochlorum sp. SENEW3]|nr:hypothetical protein PSENEW3n2_00000882 [Picochlorum sp. SENEW3]WPT15804.1 hypothetical protein PSENEW3_00000882 [Picochlorum sp. SENEW3]
MTSHYRTLEYTMKKQGKSDPVTRPKLEHVSEDIVNYSVSRRRRRNPRSSCLEESNIDMDFHIDGPDIVDAKDDSDWIPDNEKQTGLQTMNFTIATNGKMPDEEDATERGSGPAEEEEEEQEGEEEEEEEQEEGEGMDLEKQLECAADAFAQKRTEKEVYGTAVEQSHLVDMACNLEEWRLYCSQPLFEDSGGTIGEDVRDLLGFCLKRATPIGSVWELFDYCSTHNPRYPTGKDLRSLVHRMGLRFLLEVTCDKHHPPQPHNARGTRCCHSDGPGNDTCDSTLKIGIRRDSIKNYLTRKFLDPVFCQLVEESNQKYWKDTGSAGSNDYMSSIFHGQMYQSLSKRYPNFFYSDDHIPIHLGIFADGFQPFDGVAYTLFAVILVCFNLPPEVRMREENLHILTLIDGPKEPGAKLQQYIQPIVDELLELWEKGWELNHAGRSDKVLIKGACTCCLQDGRASKACSMQSEAGHYHGCRLCTIHGQQANGVHYFGHTHLLPLDHPYRLAEGDGSPLVHQIIIKDDEFIRKRMDELERCPDLSKETVFMGVQGKSEFARLPYYDLSVGHVLCFMHCLANTVKRLEKIAFEMMDAEQKASIRQYLKDIKPNSTVRSTFDRFFQAVESSNSDEPPLTKKRAQQYKDFALTGVMTSALMAAGIQQDYVDAVHKLFFNLEKLLSDKIRHLDLDGIETQIWEAICDLEKCVDPKYMTLAIHSMGHFPRQVKYLGPIRETWAYGTESKLGNLKRKTFNRFLPGACIMHRQCYEESLRFLSRTACNHADLPDTGSSLPNGEEGIVIRGPPKRRRLDDNGYPLADVQRYICEHWKEFSTAVEKVGCEDADTFWEWHDEFCIGEDPENFTGREMGIVGIQPTEAYFYKSFTVGKRIFETEEHSNSKSKTSNCGVIFQTESTPGEVFGRIQSIVTMQVSTVLCLSSKINSKYIILHVIHLQFDHGSELFIEVKRLQHLGEHKHLSGLQVVSPDPNDRTFFIQTHDIREQIFFSRDLTTGETCQLLVHKKGNLWTMD